MPQTASEIVKNWMNPNFKFFINRGGSIPERERFLRTNQRMKGEYLGACLDYIRWGGQTTVMCEHGASGLISFIQHWMNLNKEDLVWNEENPPTNFSLPRIKYEKCPRASESHKGSRTIKDTAGRIRCAHITKKLLKPSFVIQGGMYLDKYSQTDEIYIGEENPELHIAEGEKPSKAEQILLDLWEKEKPSEVARDVCYAILEEPENFVLPLDIILDRLNLEPTWKTVYCGGSYGYLPPRSPCKRLDELDLEERKRAERYKECQGHEQENDETVHPFDGWALAWYAQKWYEQIPDGKAPINSKSRERDCYKHYARLTL